MRHRRKVPLWLHIVLVVLANVIVFVWRRDLSLLPASVGWVVGVATGETVYFFDVMFVTSTVYGLLRHPPVNWTGYVHALIVVGTGLPLVHWWAKGFNKPGWSSLWRTAGFVVAMFVVNIVVEVLFEFVSK